MQSRDFRRHAASRRKKPFETTDTHRWTRIEN
jgi:hypothetical protein